MRDVQVGTPAIVSIDNLEVLQAVVYYSRHSDNIHCMQSSRVRRHALVNSDQFSLTVHGKLTLIN